MNVVIIEDEPLAQEKLTRYLLKYNSNINILCNLSSILDAVAWFKNNDNFDIVFMDIQLLDGISFEIFNNVSITKPVIFITAFNEYAVDAFKVNSIDYILKPITFTDVSKAMNKLKLMQNLFLSNEKVAKIQQVIKQKKYKDRFLVRLGNHIHSIKTDDIALFYAEGRTVYLVTNENKKFIVDYKLEDITTLLTPEKFFRVNRSFMLQINAIQDVLVYANSRLKITPKVKTEKEVIVSREKVAAFKNWFEGN